MVPICNQKWGRVFLIFATIILSAFQSIAAELAFELLNEGSHKESALEFRRLSYGATNDYTKALWHLMSAYAYKEAGEFTLASSSLDRSEALDIDSFECTLTLLRADIAYKRRNYPEAVFYYSSLGKSATESDILHYAREGHIASLLLDGKVERAIRKAEDGDKELVEPLLRYGETSRKRPWVGGLFGIIPGMGYLYSGEYGNCIRSLVLNGLFAWAMIDTAKDEDWGLFSVATFFELTWYTGSIYGGIDAAKRHNKEALDNAIAEIRSTPEPKPIVTILPVLSFRFGF